MEDTDTYPNIRGAMTMADVAELAGVQVKTIKRYHLNGEAGLPAPKATLGRSPIWEYRAIQRWIARRPGRGRPRGSGARKGS